MIVILGDIISRITPILILLLYTTTIFIQCIVKKKQKKGGKLASSPTDGKGGPPALPSPGTASKKPPTQQNTSYQVMKGRQKPMVVFEDEVTKSMPKTPKTKSVEESSMKVNRNASNSSKFDSSASVHEKETVPETSKKTVTPAKKNDSVEENVENSVESDEQ